MPGGPEGRPPKPALTDAECKLATDRLEAAKRDSLGRPRRGGLRTIAIEISQLRAEATGEPLDEVRVSPRWLQEALDKRGVLVHRLAKRRRTPPAVVL